MFSNGHFKKAFNAFVLTLNGVIPLMIAPRRYHIKMKGFRDERRCKAYAKDAFRQCPTTIRSDNPTTLFFVTASDDLRSFLDHDKLTIFNPPFVLEMSLGNLEQRKP